MKRLILLAPCLLIAWSAVTATPAAEGTNSGAVSPLFGVSIPDGYRRWPLVAAAHETDPLNELRAVLGNAPAMQAYADNGLPFPDGTTLVKLVWQHVQSPEFAPAFIPGMATTVQVMVKDSKRYPDTGGWGFGRFVDGKPVDAAQHRACFACHAANVRDHDFVFTRFAP